MLDTVRSKWEKVAQDTCRLAVPGGWLYRYEKDNRGKVYKDEKQAFQGTLCICFVPRPLKELE